MNDLVTILGFYFTLIGFISGIFFTRLDSWNGEVRSEAARFSTVKDDERAKLSDSRPRFLSLSESSPTSSFIAVGAFVSGLAILGLGTPLLFSSVVTVNIFVLLYIPVIATVVAYWLGGYFILRTGHKKISGAQNRINRLTR